MLDVDRAPHDVTLLLDAWMAGERQALDRLMPLVENDLRRLARSLMGRHAARLTLQPTALVNEAYLRLAGGRRLSWAGRLQFFAYAATTMRRILANYLRDQRAAKRGGLAVSVSLEDVFELPAPPGAGAGDLLDLEAALVQLGEVDPRQVRIVELRYFGGLSVEETAQALELSPRTIKREWHSARLFLLRALRAS